MRILLALILFQGEDFLEVLNLIISIPKYLSLLVPQIQYGRQNSECCLCVDIHSPQLNYS